MNKSLSAKIDKFDILKYSTKDTFKRWKKIAHILEKICMSPKV